MDVFPINKLTKVDFGNLVVDVEPTQMGNGSIRCRVEMRLIGHFIYRDIKQYPGGIADFNEKFPDQYQAAMTQLGKLVLYSKPAFNPQEPTRFYIGFDKRLGCFVAPVPYGDGNIELTPDYKPNPKY